MDAYIECFVKLYCAEFRTEMDVDHIVTAARAKQHGSWLCTDESQVHQTFSQGIYRYSTFLSLNLEAPRDLGNCNHSQGQICSLEHLDSQGYLDNSFDTIAGFGANGAIVHYVAQVARRLDLC